MQLYNKIATLFEKLLQNREVLYAAVGLGLVRGCLGWILTFIRNEASSLVPVVPFHIYVGVGEVIGFLLVAFLCRKLVLLKDSLAAFIMAPAAILCGVVIAFFAASSSLVCPGLLEVCYALSSILFGFGFAGLFASWMEYLSLMTPRKMLLAFASAYFINLLMWVFTREMSFALSSATCVMAAVTASLLLPIAHRPGVVTIRPSTPFPRKLISLRLLVWCMIFAFAYGVGDSITHMGNTTVASKFGMAAPDIIVLVCLWLIPAKFELRFFYRMTFALMLFGLSGSFFPEFSAVISQGMMSAANESCWLFALIIACFVAYQNKTSSAYYVGLIMAILMFFIRVGVVCDVVFPAYSTVLYIVSLALVVVFGTFLLREERFDNQLHLAAHGSSQEAVLRELAAERGLSNREEAVFLQLAEGKSFESISEELFIAPSTVRAHASRIYEKFDVHTKVEFEHRVEQEVKQRRHV